MSTKNHVKNNIDKLYKVKIKPQIGEKDAIYFVGNPISDDYIDLFVTDKIGNPIPIIDKNRFLSNLENDNLGWIQFTNTLYTESNPFIVPSNSRVTIPFTPEFTLSSNSYTENIENIFVSDLFYPEFSGDLYFLRIRFKISTTLNNRDGLLDLNIGGNQGIIWDNNYKFSRFKEDFIPFTEQIMVYSLETFLVNGGNMGFTIDGGAEIYDISCVIYKAFNGQ